MCGVYVYNNCVYKRKSASCLSGGPTNNREEIKLQEALNRVLRISAAILAGLFVLAAIAEWVRSAYAPFHGLAPDHKWIQGVKNFVYLMAMFNILLVRYVIMRIYIAPGEVNFSLIVNRLSKAGIASMLTSGLPCLYGLALFLLTGDLVDFYLIFGLSIIYCMIFFPRYKNWVSVVEEKTEAE